MNSRFHPIGRATLILLLIAGAAATAFALPPTLTEIQTAIQDQNLDWTAASQSVWQKTWAQKDSLLGCLFPAKSADTALLRRLPRGYLRELPDSIDWRDHGDTNYVSSVKDQGSCGSCWAFAACGVVESLRKIKGYSPCGVENLSEEFLVSCNVGVGQNHGCHGGYPDRTANYLQNTGVPDEACFQYQAVELLCAQACNDWATRVRKISGWSYIRDGGSVTNQTVDSMKTALTVAPQWTTMYVYDDFFAYDGGVYEYATGDLAGGHAILLVGYNDADNCFICKNSWGTDWGESGYFRIGYSQVSNDVGFGKWTINYDMDPDDDESVDDCHRYGLDFTRPYDWLPGVIPSGIIHDEQVGPVQPGFPVKYFCTTYNGPILACSNGWLSMNGMTRDTWPEHACIPDEYGPGAMVAPLWTDLDPTGGEILSGGGGGGRWVIEYRNVLRKDTGARETFEIVFYDPLVYPTPTGDAMIGFQYQMHPPSGDYQTIGIENQSQSCGVQMYCNGEGMPAAPGMAVTFMPVPYGDEHPAQAPAGLQAEYAEPYGSLGWENPLYNTEGYELPFLDRVVVERDGDVIAELHGAPGETMSWLDREPGPGQHTYAVYAVAGSATGLSASVPLEVPVRVDHRDHDAGNVIFTVTDQGICGFTDATQTTGRGFLFGPGSANRLYVGGLWAGTDAEYALNRDYDADPYPDWRFVASFSADKQAADQEFFAVCDDAGHPYARALRVAQRSRAWASAPDNDFVIVEYRLHNDGAEPLADLYVGQFMDWDVSPSNPWAERGGTDPASRLVYMYHDASLPWVGVAVLDTLPPEQAPAANLTLIHNPTFVYPLGHISDADRALFLSGADPAHSVATSWEANDWGTLASAGPFTLAAGDSVTVAFAVLGGTTLADLVTNAQEAERLYQTTSSNVDDWAAETRLSLAGGRPNPLRAGTTLHFTLPGAAAVELAIFDANGRLVRTLVDGVIGAGAHDIRWDGCTDEARPVASGVYFARLKADGRSMLRRVVVVR